MKDWPTLVAAKNMLHNNSRFHSLVWIPWLQLKSTLTSTIGMIGCIWWKYARRSSVKVFFCGMVNTPLYWRNSRSWVDSEADIFGESKICLGIVWFGCVQTLRMDVYPGDSPVTKVSSTGIQIAKQEDAEELWYQYRKGPGQLYYPAPKPSRISRHPRLSRHIAQW